jgi:aldehyde dehydrogenase (NAD+)
VVNLLTGFRPELIPTFATHAHLRGLAGVANAAERKQLRLGAADSVKRVKLGKAEESFDWFSGKTHGLDELRDHLEFKTVWHPIGA